MQQNLFGSHDTARLASHIVNRDLLSYRDWDQYFARSHAARDFNSGKPDAVDKQIQKLFVIFQMTYVGAPMIYYGDEVGMWGCNDPCCRKPMIWDDMVYDDEIYLPDGSKRELIDPVDVDHDLLDHYRVMARIRNNHMALRRGAFVAICIDDEQGVYGFARRYESQHILVLINAYDRVAEVKLKEKGMYQDILNDHALMELNQHSISIPARWARIMVKENSRYE